MAEWVCSAWTSAGRVGSYFFELRRVVVQQLNAVSEYVSVVIR